MLRKKYPLALGAIILIAVIGIYVTATKRVDRTTPSAPPATAAPDKSAGAPPSPSSQNASPTLTPPPLAGTTEPKIPRKGPLRIRKGDPIPEIFPNQAQRDEINRLATLPADQALAPLVEYLKHADPLVREEARTALIRLSSPAAVPYLRDAAKKVKSPEESTDLLDAADFLSSVSF